MALWSIGAGAALGAFSRSSEQKFIPYNVFGTVTSSCPHGQHVNFGGFKTDTIVPFHDRRTALARLDGCRGQAHEQVVNGRRQPPRQAAAS